MSVASNELVVKGNLVFAIGIIIRLVKQQSSMQIGERPSTIFKDGSIIDLSVILGENSKHYY